jgi:hypothetical protein
MLNSTEFGVCRKVERYTAKILAHPIDKRTSPINRTRNPDAMDIDAMSTEKRAALMRKGACFKCEEPGHLVRDHDEYERKKKGNGKISKTILPRKNNIREIHALLQGLLMKEKKELLALQTSDQEKETKEEKEDDEDF